MIFSGNGILLDIEGTTSSISFVYDVMFPFARRELDRFLETRWEDSELEPVRQQMARDEGFDSFADWVQRAAGSISPCELLRQEAIRLMDDDVKATGLKQLQGVIWQSGFESGELRAHVYDDVRPALVSWQQQNLDVRIFSSGSVQAQRLFFAHTIEGDLLGYFRGHYDTTTGAKREPASYRTIVGQFGMDPAQLLFVSDVTEELDAARETGLSTALCVRPGNPETESDGGHPVVAGLHEIRGK